MTGAMKRDRVTCPHCGAGKSAVVDSRGIHRRRRCDQCRGRFNTREIVIHEDTRPKTRATTFSKTPTRTG